MPTRGDRGAPGIHRPRRRQETPARRVWELEMARETFFHSSFARARRLANSAAAITRVGLSGHEHKYGDVPFGDRAQKPGSGPSRARDQELRSGGQRSEEHTSELQS